MDVSALSVSIDVDMSGFIDAMEQVAAMLIAVAEEFEKVAKDFQDSFSKITQSGEETKSFWGKLIDFVLTAFGAFDALKKIIGFATDVLKYFGIIGEEVTATELLGWFLELVGVTAELAEPIGWAVLAVSALGIAYESVFGSSSKTNNALAGTAAVAGAMAGAIGKASTNLESFKQSLNIKNADGTLFGDQAISTKKLKNSTPSRVSNDTDNSQSTYSTEDGINGKKAIDDFISNTKNIYEQLKESFPPDAAHIKVNASAVASNDRTADSSQAVDPNMAMDTTPVDNSIDKLNQLQAAMAKTAEQGGKLSDSQKQLANTISNTSVTIGADLMKIAQGKGSVQDVLRNVLKSFTDMLAQFIKKKGDALIQMGIGDIAAGIGLLALGNPYGAKLEVDGAGELAGGAALDVASGAISAIKMAAGGIVSGSTFANVGEYAGASHNPEVVAPLDKLRKIICGNNGGGHYSFEMQGDKMVAAMQRQSNNNNFVLGTNNQ